jgi:hypothetical protein
MRFNPKHIIEGIINTVQAKEEIEKIASERREICAGCKFNSNNDDKKRIRPDAHCTICSCNLTLKTHSLSSSCPINKWPAVATEEEDEEIDKKLGSDEQQGI